MHKYIKQQIYPGQNLGFRIKIIPSFVLQIPVILANLFCKNYSKVISHHAGAVMHDLKIIPNATVLLHTMVLPPIELVEHVRYTDVGSIQHLRFFCGTVNNWRLNNYRHKKLNLRYCEKSRSTLREPYEHLFCISNIA